MNLVALRNVGFKRIGRKIIYEVRKKLVQRRLSPIASPISLDEFRKPSLIDVARCWALHGTKHQDSNLSEIVQGKFSIKGVEYDFKSVNDIAWDDPFKGVPEKSNWIYEFSYFYFMIPCARQNPALTVRVISDLIKILERKHSYRDFPSHKVWLPIVISIRSLTLISIVSNVCDDLGPESSDDLAIITAHIARCNEIICHTAERYLGFNHEAFGLVAAAIGLSIREPHTTRARSLAAEAARSIAAQVGNDGFQLEGSATYHLHVLHLACILRSALLLNPDDQEALDVQIKKMQSAASVMVHPDGDVALFSDSALDDAIRPSLLGVGTAKPRIGKIALANAGYVKICNDPVTAFFDVGNLAPGRSLGHAHVDFLSVEISWGTSRLVVDPGVRAYAAGRRRTETRSISIHNSPRFKEIEPAELFGAWRVGRSGRAMVVPGEMLPNFAPVEEAARYRGYANSSALASRYVGIRGCEILIADTWAKNLKGFRVSSFLLPSEWTVTQESELVISLTSTLSSQALTFEVSQDALIVLEESYWNPLGGMTDANATLVHIMPSADQAILTIRDKGVPNSFLIDPELYKFKEKIRNYLIDIPDRINGTI